MYMRKVKTSSRNRITKIWIYTLKMKKKFQNIKYNYVYKMFLGKEREKFTRLAKKIKRKELKEEVIFSLFK